MKEAFIPYVSGFDSLGQFAVLKIDCVNWKKEFPYKPRVRVFTGHDEEKLLIRFEVKEENAKAVTLESNGPVWEDSCVEFFVKVPDSEFYYNFETNCIGTGLVGKRRSRTDFVHFSPEQIDQVIKRTSLKREVCDIKGGVEWSLELEIPFKLIGCAKCPSALLANFYKCGDKTETPHFVSWAPIDTPSPDFHRPEFFGKLILDK